MKVEIGEKTVTVKARVRGWRKATDLISDFRTRPPDGYKLVTGSVSPRTRNDGSYAAGDRCNLDLVFIHVDRRVPQFTESEAFEFFRDEGLETR